MIGDVQRGNFMPDLISYLFGPGKHNEHINQHLVAGYGDAVFGAADRLWQSEPGVQRKVAAEARELGWQVEYPHSRWGVEVPRGYVWHCSLSVRAGEGQLTDAQWTQAAHAVVDAMGFSAASGKAPCRWVAVRHGLSREGNDHIHVAVNLVREDGTKASTWNDYRTVGRVCTGLEERFGLEHVAGRMTGRSVPEPSRADREIAVRRGEAQPLRIRLERRVRACAAAAGSEAAFVALARAHGLLIRPRYAAGDRRQVVGYTVAERGGRIAFSSRTGTRGPVWFGGGKLASDLALPRLRERWEGPGAEAALARIEALAAWSAAQGTAAPGGLAAGTAGGGMTPDKARVTAAHRQLRDLRQSAESLSADAGYSGEDGGSGWSRVIMPTADVLAAAAVRWEGDRGGPLSQAARQMARAAVQQPGTSRSGAAAAVRDVASVFVTTALAGSTTVEFGALLLMREVSRLADACADARAATREAREASALVRASLADLTAAAGVQARRALAAYAAAPQGTGAATVTRKGATMSEASHEEELLRHLTQAGVLGAQLARTGIETFTQASGKSRIPNGSAMAAQLEAAGYTRETAHDGHLRALLGEERWSKYADDPGRIVCAAMITDGERAGHDMPALLGKVVRQRGWENDPIDSARSIARVLAYRVEQQLRDGTFLRQQRSPGQRGQAAADGMAGQQKVTRPRVPSRQDRHVPVSGARAAYGARPAEAPPRTPYDDRLRELLGEQRWEKYASDPRRRDVAGLIGQAASQGRDVDALLVHVVGIRPFEDDPRSPARRVAAVLHHRIEAVLGTSTFLAPAAGSQPAGAEQAQAAGQAGDAKAADTGQPRVTAEQLTRAEEAELARRAGQLPPAIAKVISQAAAPAGSRRGDSAQSDPDPARDQPPPSRQPGRQPAQRPDHERG